jgi:hypothetical protein
MKLTPLSIDPITIEIRWPQPTAGPFVHTYPYMLLLYDALTHTDHVEAY